MAHSLLHSRESLRTTHFSGKPYSTHIVAMTHDIRCFNFLSAGVNFGVEVVLHQSAFTGKLRRSNWMVGSGPEQLGNTESNKREPVSQLPRRRPPSTSASSTMLNLASRSSQAWRSIQRLAKGMASVTERIGDTKVPVSLLETGAYINYQRIEDNLAIVRDRYVS